MRVTENELVREVGADVGDVEIPFLRSDFGIEEHVQQDVAQLLADVLPVVVKKGVAEFIDLFYGVWPQALVGLLPVPRAFDAELVEDVEYAAEFV